jgi:hypothetical protein
MPLQCPFATTQPRRDFTAYSESRTCDTDDIKSFARLPEFVRAFGRKVIGVMALV